VKPITHEIPDQPSHDARQTLVGKQHVGSQAEELEWQPKSFRRREEYCERLPGVNSDQELGRTSDPKRRVSGELGSDLDLEALDAFELPDQASGIVRGVHAVDPELEIGSPHAEA
jgi:hypothetical protein